jgi:hypothetical protein
LVHHGLAVHELGGGQHAPRRTCALPLTRRMAFPFPPRNVYNGQRGTSSGRDAYSTGPGACLRGCTRIHEPLPGRWSRGAARIPRRPRAVT